MKPQKSNKNTIEHDNDIDLFDFSLTQFGFSIKGQPSGLTSHGSQSAYNLNQYKEK